MSKKIAMIIAFKEFKDEEYFIPRFVFKKNGHSVTTVSSHRGMAVGVGGGEAIVDLDFNNFHSNEFDAIVFVGGSGASRFLDDEDVSRILQEAKDMIIGAICIAPAILAKNGILEGKKATVWSNNMDKSLIGILEENGAIYEDLPVVTDGKIVTANGPMAAKDFADAVIDVLDK